jgi:hypothetical protein
VGEAEGLGLVPLSYASGNFFQASGAVLDPEPELPAEESEPASDDMPDEGEHDAELPPEDPAQP